MSLKSILIYSGITYNISKSSVIRDLDCFPFLRIRSFFYFNFCIIPSQNLYFVHLDPLLTRSYESVRFLENLISKASVYPLFRRRERKKYGTERIQIYKTAGISRNFPRDTEGAPFAHQNPYRFTDDRP